MQEQTEGGCDLIIDPPPPYAAIEVLAAWVQELEAMLKESRWAASARVTISLSLEHAREDLARARLEWLHRPTTENPCHPFYGSGEG